MEIIDPYPSITVFRDEKKHILIQDIYYPVDRDPNFYFDIHMGLGYNINDIKKKKALKEVGLKEKELACSIYMDWKWLKKDKEAIRKKANKKMPINGYLGAKESKIHKDIEILSNEKSQLEDFAQSINNLRKQYQDTRKPVVERLVKQETKKMLDSRAKGIQNVIDERKISELVHFTNINNLLSIMERGLLSRKEVEKLSPLENVIVNDDQRVDKHPEAICLSISFPNYKMFYRFHQRKYDNWVVISLKPDILWKYDCAFCHTNAASNSCRFINIFERKKVQALKRLFEDCENKKRQDLHIPVNFPTDPQAEVLVFNRIPLEDFQKIYFYSYATMTSVRNSYINYKDDLFACERKYFLWRADFEHW